MRDWTRFFVLLLVVSILAGGGPALAQERDSARPGVLSGVVHGAETGEPLPGANVVVRRASDSTLVDGTATDTTGHFTVSALPIGSFRVVASFVGHASRARTVTLTKAKPESTLAPFQLPGRAAQMEEAAVTGERAFVTTQGSKRVYNLDQREVALAGQSAVDVLRDLPSLRVDEMNGAIHLRGDANVSIHVNGDPVSMDGKALVQYLKSLSADDVEQVEVNTNPSARHDAEGTAGIINIVLDRNEAAGLSGSVSASAGVGPRLDGAGTLGYQDSPWTLHGSYSYNHNERDLVQDLLRHRPESDAPPLLDQTTARQMAYGGHSLNAEIDYALTPKTTLSLTSTGNVWGTDQNHSTTAHGPDAPASPREIERSYQSRRLDERLSVSHAFDDENHELAADLRYEGDKTETTVREEQTSTPPRERQDDTDTQHNAEATLDYTRPLGAWTIETGYKGALRVLDEHYDIWQFDDVAGQFPETPTEQNARSFREQVQAGYSTLQRSLGPFDAEVGLRMEHTRTTIDPQDDASASNQYTDLFPSASLTYERGRGRRVSLSYSKRIDRPHLHQLSAFRASSDPYVRFEGNPNLDPETIHKAELTVMQTLGPATVTVSPYARRTTDAIEWTTVRDDSVTVRSYDNYDANTSYGAELNTSLRLGKALKANISGNAYRRVTQGGPLASGARRTRIGFMGRAHVTWTVRPGLRLQGSQFYRAPMDTGLGRMDGRSRTRLAIEQTFWDDNGSLGLRVQDPFNTSEMGLRTRTGSVAERLTRDWDGRTVSLSFSYRFGNSKQKKNRQSQPGGGGLSPMGGG
jgi:outer membrane cobalamin receptor